MDLQMRTKKDTTSWKSKNVKKTNKKRILCKSNLRKKFNISDLIEPQQRTMHLPAAGISLLRMLKILLIAV